MVNSSGGADGVYEYHERLYFIEGGEDDVWHVRRQDGVFIGELSLTSTWWQFKPLYAVRFAHDDRPEPKFAEGWEAALVFLLSAGIE